MDIVSLSQSDYKTLQDNITEAKQEPKRECWWDGELSRATKASFHKSFKREKKTVVQSTLIPSIGIQIVCRLFLEYLL